MVGEVFSTAARNVRIFEHKANWNLLFRYDGTLTTWPEHNRLLRKRSIDFIHINFSIRLI